MRHLLTYLVVALVVLSIGLYGCSKKEETEPEKKGAIEKMTDEVAHTAVKKIRTPIDQAHSAKAVEEERAKAMDEALQHE
jgi:PBP1b-binding outer membrane lipoprotein LpoB